MPRDSMSSMMSVRDESFPREPWPPAPWEARALRRPRRHHHSPLVPLAIFMFIFLAAHGPMVFAALVFAAALAVSGAAMVLVARTLAPSLPQETRSRGVASPQLGQERPYAPISAVPRPAPGLSVERSYQRRLLDVLKERYVRGEITLEEFERRAGQIAHDPSVRYLA